jgi:[acyl-carrier-protein] S-malonyltransferase
MAALLGLDDDAVRAACAEAAQGEVVAAANFNAPGQIVIAGSTKAVDRAIEAAKARGAKRAVLLPVSAPFHCELMKPAADRLKHALAEVAIAAPGIPVLHNCDVQTRDEPEAIRQALVSQAFSPVRWAETIRAMAAMGVTHVFECGPGKVLAGLTRRIESGLQGAALADASGIEQALASLG